MKYSVIIYTAAALAFSSASALAFSNQKAPDFGFEKSGPKAGLDLLFRKGGENSGSGNSGSGGGSGNSGSGGGGDNSGSGGGGGNSGPGGGNDDNGGGESNDDSGDSGAGIGNDDNDELNKSTEAARAQIERIEVGENIITIYYLNGWVEILALNTYELRDNKNRRVIRRRSTRNDIRRFELLLGR